MKGQRADCVTSPRSGEVMTGIDDGQGREADKEINRSALATVEITPVKAAPSDIKSAIRRQKRTETVDYVWHALPITRSSKPLYRAVLHGSLRSGRIHYTLTNWSASGQAFRTADGPAGRDDTPSPSFIDANNNSNNNLPGFGLRVAGVSINDIKFQEPSTVSGGTSPRARQPQLPVPASRCMKPGFPDQKNASNGPRSHRKADEIDFNERDSERSTLSKSSLAPPEKQHSNGTPHSTKSVNGNVRTSGRSSESSASPSSFSPRPTDEVSDRLSSSNSPSAMSSRTENNIEGNTLLKSKSPSKARSKHNDKMVSTSTTAKQSICDQIERKFDKSNASDDKNVHKNLSGSNLDSSSKLLSDSANQSRGGQRSPRRAADSYPAFTRETNVNELTCIQLADSIIGAARGDFNQVYSFCKSKLRYSDYIEQAQPHRLGGAPLQGISDLGDPSQARGIRSSLEMPQSPELRSNACLNGRSALLSISRESRPKLPGINESQKTYHLQLKTPNYLNIPSKVTRGKDHALTTPAESIQSEEASLTLTLAKAGRPILKSSKSEIEPSAKAKNVMSGSVGEYDMAKENSEHDDTYSRNINVGSNNRLVRFNTCHEIREFTPSEPIVQS